MPARAPPTHPCAPGFKQYAAKPAVSACWRIAPRRTGTHVLGSRRCSMDSRSVCRSHPKWTPRPGPQRSNRTYPLRRCPSIRLFAPRGSASRSSGLKRSKPHSPRRRVRSTRDSSHRASEAHDHSRCRADRYWAWLFAARSSGEVRSRRRPVSGQGAREQSENPIEILVREEA